MINFITVTSEGKSNQQFNEEVEQLLNNGYGIYDKGSCFKTRALQRYFILGYVS